MKTIEKTDLVPMDAPADGWYHIESNEEHPAQREGGEIVQVLDNEAMQAIVAAGVPEEGIPIDADHRGVPGVAEVPDTAAAGWVRELALFDDGAGNMQLAGRIEWTSIFPRCIVWMMRSWPRGWVATATARWCCWGWL